MKEFNNQIRIEQSVDLVHITGVNQHTLNLINMAQEVKKNIGNAHYEEALNTLPVMIDSSNRQLYNQALALQSRYNNWKNEEIFGNNPPIEEFNKIISSVLQFVDKIDDNLKSTQNRIDNINTFGADNNIASSVVELKLSFNHLKTLPKSLIKCKDKLLTNIPVNSFRLKVWIALLPQLEGTIKTVMKLIEELINILEAEQTIIKMENEIKPYIIEPLTINRDIKLFESIEPVEFENLQKVYVSLKPIIYRIDKLDSEPQKE